MRIYVSGGITHDPEYRRKFADACFELQSKGYETINPAPMYLVYSDGKWEEYISICMHLMEYADGIYMLKGWEDSKGARQEHEKAIRMNLPIYYQGGEKGKNERKKQVDCQWK